MHEQPQGPRDSHPTFVSVVIPSYNEQRFILKALNQLVGQFENNLFEILVVDGRSEDLTRELVAQFAREHSGLSIRVIDNPARHIPAALNLGIQASRGNVIARMDAHAMPSEGYIRRCVEVLQQQAVGVVGMPCHIVPGADSLMAIAIANAVSHPFGIGNAKYRLKRESTTQESVDTVAFACFSKNLWTDVGGFDESLLTNEDYEFNYRVRQSGKLVILDHSGHCTYFARSTLAGLARQYFRYGSWKVQMLKRHPTSAKLRHLITPLFLISLIVLFALGFLTRWAWVMLGIELLVYLLVGLCCAVGMYWGRATPPSVILLMPIVFPTIHASWGTGFLLGLFNDLGGKDMGRRS